MRRSGGLTAFASAPARQAAFAKATAVRKPRRDSWVEGMRSLPKGRLAGIRLHLVEPVC